MASDLVSGRLYKIISVQSGLVVSLSPGTNNVEARRDVNADYQIVGISPFIVLYWLPITFVIKWRAENASGGQWSLRSLRQVHGRAMYLNWPGNEPRRGLPLIGSPAVQGWDITQWETRGGVEYRIWVHGAPSPGTVADLRGGNTSEGTPIETWESNNGAPQFWLFQETTRPSN